MNNTEIYSSSFRLSKEFSHPKSDKMAAVTIKLDIDYRSKTFSITPINGTDKFEFRVGSHESAMWKAIAELIKEACEFGDKELNPMGDPF